MWNEDQTLYAIELILKYGTSDWETVTAIHNERFGVERTYKALQGLYRRLRDTYAFSRHEKVMGLLNANPDLFFKQKKAIKDDAVAVETLQKEILDLKKHLVTKDRQVDDIMEMVRNLTATQLPLRLPPREKEKV